MRAEWCSIPSQGLWPGARPMLTVSRVEAPAIRTRLFEPMKKESAEHDWRVAKESERSEENSSWGRVDSTSSSLVFPFSQLASHNLTYDWAKCEEFRSRGTQGPAK